MREAATLLNDILARDLDDETSKPHGHVRLIFDRNHSVLRAALDNDLLGEAKEIARLMVTRGMLLHGFVVSQICQASTQA